MKSSAKNMKQSASQMQSLKGLSESQRMALMTDAERVDYLKSVGRYVPPEHRQMTVKAHKAFGQAMMDAINNQPRPKQ